MFRAPQVHLPPLRHALLRRQMRGGAHRDAVPQIHGVLMPSTSCVACMRIVLCSVCVIITAGPLRLHGVAYPADALLHPDARDSYGADL